MQPNPTVYDIGGKSCNRTLAAPESRAKSKSQAACSGNLCTYAADGKSCNKALHAGHRAAYVMARRGAQRLCKAIRGGRGSGYSRYAARVADGGSQMAGRRRRVADGGSRTVRSGYGTVGSTTSRISLYFKLCERRNSECTRVVKVPVFAKVMPGFQLSLYARERLRTLMS